MKLTREGVIRALKACSDSQGSKYNACVFGFDCEYKCERCVLTIAAELLEQDIRTPDAVTGLVNCGCGGKAQIINSSGYSRRLYVECDRCAIMLGVEATGDGALQGIYRYDDQIIKDWNEAMGYHPEEGAE